MDDTAAFVTEVFGEKSLYEILKVERTATESEIKQAYKKLALVHHPDRAGGDTEKFKALSIVHSILSDTSKRGIYDSTGDVDDEDTDENFKDWYDYFRNLFPMLTTAKIEEFSATYVGSEEERKDLTEAYEKYDGDMEKIMEVVIFAEEGEEERLCSTIDSIISFGDLKSTPAYEKFKVKMRKAAGKPKKKRKVEKKEDTSESDLAALILSNKSSRRNGFSDIMSKYGGQASDPYDDIDDEAFQKIQSRIVKEGNGTGKDTKETKGKKSKK